MKGEFWINIASRNPERSRKFYSDIGFEMNTVQPAPHVVSMVLGDKKIVINSFSESFFEEFIGHQKIADAETNNEVLFSLGAESTQEVDKWAQKAEKAGATIFGKPGFKDGWMYGCGFVDPDGHRWNILYMDMKKAPNF